jgi:hypothetical protein
VTSADTFTLIVESAVPVNPEGLTWSFHNPAANPGRAQTVPVGGTAWLNGTRSTDPNGAGDLTYHWELQSRPSLSQTQIARPDDVISSFVPDVPGDYAVALTVANGSGSDTAVLKVSTRNSAPVADAGPNQSVWLGSTVTLTGAASSDVDGDALTFRWTLVSRPPGSLATISGPQSVVPQFVADEPGVYAAQLIANDGTADSAPATVLVAVNTVNTPPVADAGDGLSVHAGALAQLSGGRSTDVDGDALSYRWSLISRPAGSSATLTEASAVNPAFTVDAPGVYVAQLIVNDGKVDSTPSTVTISTEAPLPPTADAGADQTAAQGAAVTLKGTGADPQQLSLTYTWSLISQPANSSAVLSAAHTARPTFTSDQPGTYVAQLVVNNGIVSSAPQTVIITTANSLPVAVARARRNVETGAAVALDGSYSTDVDRHSLTYSWSVISRPAGSNMSLQGAGTVSPTFVADVPGAYVVQLIVNDGIRTSHPKTVVVTAVAPAITITPNPLNLESATGTLFLSLPQPAPSGGLTVTLTSSNPAVASVPASLFASEGTSSLGVRVTAGSPGSTTIDASAPGLSDGTAAVTVPQPGVVSVSGPPTLVLSHTGSLTVTLTTPAPQSGVTVQIASSDTTVVVPASTSVTIPAGATSASFGITGQNVGAAAITATAPGYTAGPGFVVNVTATVIWITQNATITGIGSTTSLVLQLTSMAPYNPSSSNPWGLSVPVNLSSSNPSVATIQPVDHFIWDGSTAPGIVIVVTAVGPGTTVMHASGVNIPDATTTVTVTGSGGVLSIVTASIAGGVAGVPYSSAINASGGLAPYSWSASGLPAGLTIDPSLGAISGNPAAAGTSFVNVTVTDSSSPTHQTLTKQFTLTIGPAVSITTGALPSGQTGNAYSLTMAATGGTAPYTWSASGLPAGLSVNSSTGLISGIPQAGGSATVNITVTDASSPAHTSANKQYSLLIVSGVGITTVSLPSGYPGVAYSAQVTATGGTAPYSWAANGLPAGLAIDPSTGIVSGRAVSLGTSSPVITVTDSTSPVAETAAKAFNLAMISPTLIVTTVSLPNAPVGAGYSAAVTASGGTLPYKWSASGLPAGLAIDPNSGTISGTASSVGVSTVTVTVIDASAIPMSTSAQFSLAVVSSVGITASPANLIMQMNSTATVTIALSQPAPAGGVTFSLMSSNPSVANVVPSVSLSATASSLGVRLSSGSAGTAVVTVSAPGIGSTTVNVTVAQAGVVSVSGPPTLVLSSTGSLTVTLTTPAPRGGVTVQIASSDTTIVVPASTSVTIPAGATSASFGITGQNVGTASITATAAGYTAGPGFVVNVTATVIWVTQNATITGIGNTTFLTLQLTSMAPYNPASGNPWGLSLPVNLSSSNPSVATIQSVDHFIWDGSTAPGILIAVTAVGPGTTLIHASGVNIPDVTTTVTVIAQ